jgi:hypothetical protein
MDQIQKAQLVDVYGKYGFHLARDAKKDGILVFTLKTGYFDNAEIVKLTEATDTKAVFDEFSRAGYACTVRIATSAEKTQQELFKGFFSADTTKTRLQEEYKKFTDNIVRPFGGSATYKYIQAPYEIDGKNGELHPPLEVLNRINAPGPVLFLIEAAAGFGKTCTAQEIAHLLSETETHLPLYAELSRNRTEKWLGSSEQ